MRPRAWWEEQFRKCGVTVQSELLLKLQAVHAGASNREVLAQGPAKSLMDEFQWFLDDPPYQLAGELEPWLFIFRKPD